MYGVCPKVRPSYFYLLHRLNSVNTFWCHCAGAKWSCRKDALHLCPDAVILHKWQSRVTPEIHHDPAFCWDGVNVIWQSGIEWEYKNNETAFPRYIPSFNPFSDPSLSLFSLIVDCWLTKTSRGKTIRPWYSVGISMILQWVVGSSKDDWDERQEVRCTVLARFTSLRVQWSPDGLR